MSPACGERPRRGLCYLSAVAGESRRVDHHQLFFSRFGDDSSQGIGLLHRQKPGANLARVGLQLNQCCRSRRVERQNANRPFGRFRGSDLHQAGGFACPGGPDHCDHVPAHFGIGANARAHLDPNESLQAFDVELQGFPAIPASGWRLSVALKKKASVDMAASNRSTMSFASAGSTSEAINCA